jgi:hypothetical protein
MYLLAFARQQQNWHAKLHNGLMAASRKQIFATLRHRYCNKYLSDSRRHHALVMHALEFVDRPSLEFTACC